MASAHSLLFAALTTATLAFAQVPAPASPNAGFDCWIGNDGRPYFTYFIRCIADRDIAPAASTDIRFDVVLDQLHRELHEGSSAGAEQTFISNIELINESAGVWNIRIYSYPPDWSWEEGMPERLVHAVLCPEAGACPILIRRH